MKDLLLRAKTDALLDFLTESGINTGASILKDIINEVNSLENENERLRDELRLCDQDVTDLNEKLHEI